MAAIELERPERKRAIDSIKRYVEENMIEPIGDLQAGLLLDFILEDVGPSIYNQAIRDAQSRMVQRASDLEGELYAEPSQYWPKLEARRKKRQEK